MATDFQWIGRYIFKARDFVEEISHLGNSEILNRIYVVNALTRELLEITMVVFRVNFFGFHEVNSRCFY